MGRCAGAPAAAALIVTDSVFSMDGDVAPLAEIVELARRHGVRRRRRRGARHRLPRPRRPRRGRRGRRSSGEVDVVVGTLGKALGAYGAYAALRRATMRAATWSTRARSLIFSTAPPPPAVAGALAALELLVEQPRRVERLQANADALRDELAREGFDVAGSTTQIVPLIVGDAAHGDARSASRRSSAASSPRRSARRRCPRARRGCAWR